MTIDVEKLSGKALAAVIEALCMAVTPRWKSFFGTIKISKHQTINCRDPENIRGILILENPRTRAEIQEEADGAAFAVVLRPLFSAIAEGKVFVLGNQIPARPDSVSISISPFLMSEPWELHLFGHATLTTLDDGGRKTGSFRLTVLRVSSTADEAVARIRREAENAKPRASGAGGAPPEYDWPLAETALTKYFEEEGTPGKIRGAQAAAERFLHEWFMQRYGKSPSESLIRDHVKAVAARLDQVIREGR